MRKSCSHLSFFTVRVGKHLVHKCRGCTKSWLPGASSKKVVDSNLSTESVLQSMQYYCKKQDKETFVRLGNKIGLSEEEIEIMYAEATANHFIK